MSNSREDKKYKIFISLFFIMFVIAFGLIIVGNLQIKQCPSRDSFFIVSNAGHNI